MTLPRGAVEIVEARANGMKPADPIVVNFGDRLPWRYPQVFPWRSDHDWAFMAGLEAMVCVSGPHPLLQSTLRALARPCEVISLYDPKAVLGMDIWPVWKGVATPEIHVVPLADRRDAIFVRWAFARWISSDYGVAA